MRVLIFLKGEYQETIELDAWGRLFFEGEEVTIFELSLRGYEIQISL